MGMWLNWVEVVKAFGIYLLARYPIHQFWPGLFPDRINRRHIVILWAGDMLEVSGLVLQSRQAVHAALPGG